MISDFSKQIDGLWLSIIFGIFLSALYDILKILRKLTRPKKSVIFVMDFLFFSFCAFITFIASFSTNYGVLRFYHILGEALGAIIYFLTLGRITLFLTKIILTFLAKIKKKISNNYQRITDSFLKNKKSKKMLKIRKKREQNA